MITPLEIVQRVRALVRATGEVAYDILSLNNTVTHKLSGEEVTGQTRKSTVQVICSLYVVKGLKLPNDKEDFRHKLRVESYRMPLMNKDSLDFTCMLQIIPHNGKQDTTIPDVLRDTCKRYPIHGDYLLVLYTRVNNPHIWVR